MVGQAIDDPEPALPEAVRQDSLLVTEFRIVYPGLPAVALSVQGPLTLGVSPYVHGAREVRGLFSSCMRVRDVHRYTICWPAGTRSPHLRPNDEGSPQFRESEFADLVPERCEVLLLLESPHVDEYACDPESKRMRPIAPAQGKTGTRIQDHLAEVLSRGDLPPERLDGARVIIANPVPYQASLGSIVKVPDVNARERKKVKSRVKDVVWQALWDIEAVRRDFKARLRRYVPRIVINGCTRTMSDARTAKCSRSACVAEFVAAHCPDAEQYETTHPSSWFNGSYRWLKRVSL